MQGEELDLIRQHLFQTPALETAEVVDRLVAKFTTWRTLGGPLGDPTWRHVILLAQAHEQCAAHAVGHPYRSIGGFEQRRWQEVVAPEGVLATDRLEAGERLRLRQNGVGARSPDSQE